MKDLLKAQQGRVERDSNLIPPQYRPNALTTTPCSPERLYETIVETFAKVTLLASGKIIVEDIFRPLSKNVDPGLLQIDVSSPSPVKPVLLIGVDHSHTDMNGKKPGSFHHQVIKP